MKSIPDLLEITESTLLEACISTKLPVSMLVLRVFTSCGINPLTWLTTLSHTEF